MRFLKPVVPPLLWAIGKDIKRRLVRSVDHYAVAPQGWDTPLPADGGNEAYWSAFVAQEQEHCAKLIERVRQGEPASTAEGETVKHASFGYVLSRAARHRNTLTVLDYGGNLGEYYWIGKAMLPGVELEYHCKELPVIASAGRALSPSVIWHVDDACLASNYDVVMFSGSLPYLPQWKEILHQAVRATRGYLWLADIPTVRGVATFLITQRTGGLTHLQYVFNQSEVIDTVTAAGLRLERQFVMGTHPPVANVPEQPMSVGLLFVRS